MRVRVRLAPLSLRLRKSTVPFSAPGSGTVLLPWAVVCLLLQQTPKAIALGALPIWTDLLADKELLAAYPYWENFGSQIDKATGLPSVLWYDEFVEILTVESQRIMLGEISVEDGLASMQTQCEALEAEYSK